MNRPPSRKDYQSYTTKSTIRDVPIALYMDTYDVIKLFALCDSHHWEVGALSVGIFRKAHEPSTYTR